MAKFGSSSSKLQAGLVIWAAPQLPAPLARVGEAMLKAWRTTIARERSTPEWRSSELASLSVCCCSLDADGTLRVMKYLERKLVRPRAIGAAGASLPVSSASSGLDNRLAAVRREK